MGHTINMAYVSNDKINTNMIAEKLKRNFLMGIQNAKEI